MALGSISDQNSLAYMLGFGGYHLITHSKNKIGPGVFNTTLTAKWTSHGEAKSLNEALRRPVPGKEAEKGCDFLNNNYGPKSSRKQIEGAFGEGYSGILDPSKNDDIKNYPSDEISKHFQTLLENKSKGL